MLDDATKAKAMSATTAEIVEELRGVARSAAFGGPLATPAELERLLNLAAYKLEEMESELDETRREVHSLNDRLDVLQCELDELESQSDKG
jgi:flagellar biosynthesis chaperone FliJ